jgi:cell division septal protein FtsQ
MKEQVVASRGARRSTARPKGFVQKPARRDGSPAARSLNLSVRTLYGYVPMALKVMVSLLIVIGLVIGYRVAASASLFQIRRIDVTGTSRTSPDEIETLTRRAVARTGVWRADLSAISAELSRLPGVRRAVVSRVLPDGLRIRVTERVPVAVVRTAAGHFVWVDDDGVALGEMKPEDHLPAVFMRGWNEDGTEEGRKENVERVQKYLSVIREWDALGLTDRVSEISLLDVRDIRVQLAGNDSQIEVRLGGHDLGSRLKIALDALDVYKQSPRGSLITYVDIQSGRVVIGFSSGNQMAAGTNTSSTDANLNQDPETTQGTATNNSNRSSGDTQSKKGNQQRLSRNNPTREQAKKPAARSH